MAFHTEKCGEENICVISEHDDNYEEDLNQEKLDFYTKDSISYFPSSNDWRFMMEHNELNIEEINSLWVKQEKYVHL